MSRQCAQLVLAAVFLLWPQIPARAEITQTADGRISFPATNAILSSAAAPVDAVAELRTSGATASWKYKPTRWGMYTVELSLTKDLREGDELEVEAAGGQLIISNLTKDRRIYLAKSEPMTLSVRARKTSGPIGLRGVTLAPAPEGAPIVQEGASITLHARDAITHSVTMRYEPATNKNCLGYWVNTNDTAEWKFSVTRPGDYEIELWQGCGKSQGGSDVLVEVRDGTTVLKEIPFVVEETGHFQTFIPRQLGRVYFPKSGEYALRVLPRRKQAGAIMDISRIVLASSEKRAGTEFPGKRSLWFGFERFDFEVAGKPVLVVAPKMEAPGRPWVWHGEFFGHKPNPDIALLGRGFHVVYMSAPDMLGSPGAVEYWNAFYETLTSRHGFAPKAALVGLSRSGLYCYNWATANPGKTACIYADAPVCDFKSWPGGFGKGKRSDRDWTLVLKLYGFSSDEEAKSYSRNPVDSLEGLARAKVPLLHIFGDADEAVPWEENTGLLGDRYQRLGGDITLIRKPGGKHHPHGLDDSTPIVDFIWKNAANSDAKAWLASRGEEGAPK